MLQASVEDFFDAVKFRPPGGFHVFEALVHLAIHVVEAASYLIKSGVDVIKAVVNAVEPGVDRRTQFADTKIHIAQAGVVYENAE